MKKTAVALHYPENAQAPFIVAKGTNQKAEKILEIAQLNNIPIVIEPETAVVLSMQDIGDCIPEETYEVLAGVFAFLKKVYDYDKH